MTDPLKRKYLKHGGKKCPHCNSISLFCGDITHDENAVYRNVVCDECKREWTDIYTLTDVTFEPEE